MIADMASNYMMTAIGILIWLILTDICIYQFNDYFRLLMYYCFLILLIAEAVLLYFIL